MKKSFLLPLVALLFVAIRGFAVQEDNPCKHTYGGTQYDCNTGFAYVENADGTLSCGATKATIISKAQSLIRTTGACKKFEE